MSPTGGLVIITFFAELLKRVQNARSIHLDATFRRTDDECKETEFSQFDRLVERGMSLA
jgi:hypothetical protein